MLRSIKKILIVSFIIIYHNTPVFGFHDSLLVSVITVEPGKEIYSLFGHTAIRIRNLSNGNDEIFNFGTFDFNEDFFYLKFIKGNLKYSLSVTDFRSFMQNVQDENRKTIEQVLNLSAEEKKQLKINLYQCYESSCRFYTYDFFYNNCATKVRDNINTTPGDAATEDSSKLTQTTFRDLLKPYIKHNYWLDLGINLALGNRADLITGQYQQMFLPEYIHKTLKESNNLLSEKVLLYGDSKKQKNHSWWTPIVITGLLISMIFFSGTRRIPLIALSVIFGLAGLVILFVSLISENPALSHNHNIYWTMPALMVLIASNSKPGKCIKYAYLVLLILILITWNLMPQTWSVTFIPWIAAMIILLVADLLKHKKRATPVLFSY